MNAPSLSIKPASEPVDFTVKAYVCDEASQEVLTNSLEDAGWVNRQVHLGGVDEAVRRLAVEESPDFLIIDLSNSEDPRLEISALAEVCEPGLTVLAIGTVNDVFLYRDLLASGIQDYLVKPLNASMLGEALSYAEASLSQEIEAAEEAGGEHRFCTFIGARGGVGATTIATSIAHLVSNEFKRKTAFLDLDIHFGAAALTFDLEPGRGLCDAIENPGRVDSLFIERATIKQNEYLSILGAEAPISDPMTADPTALSHLQGELFGAFGFVAVDMPRSMLPLSGHLLGQATDIVLVSDLSLVCARDTIRLLQYLKDNAPKVRVHLVANKVNATTCEMTKSDFEDSVERKVDFVFPLDVKSTVEASKKGVSVPNVQTATKLTSAMRTLASQVSGVSPDKAKTSLLAKLHLSDLLKKKKAKTEPSAN